MINSNTLIIFGATGNLFKRKLFPALYIIFSREIKKNKNYSFALVGTAYENVSIDSLLAECRPFITQPIKEDIWQVIVKSCYYYCLDFTKKNDFFSFKEYVCSIEKRHDLSGSRLLYCATAADFFAPITKYSAESLLITPKKISDRPWHRIVYEKPFGANKKEAQEINKVIKKYVHENQIYRIDHYLTKEVVGNIALVRFTNCIFEPLWSSRYIDNVQIILSESVGIENRGYYDKYGAVSDVVQNHMLALVALIAMEKPKRLKSEDIRQERAKVLEDVEIKEGIFGQYEGYKKEKTINYKSSTETFAALFFYINNARWAGVPFYLKTGKHLVEKKTVIVVKFKQVACLLKSCPRESNYLTINIDPDAGFSLMLNVKKPFFQQAAMPISMKFSHDCLYEGSVPEAYEILLQELIRGERSVSVLFEEVERAWDIVQKIKAKNFPLYVYKKGSNGPKELALFNKKHGIRWYK